MQDWALSDPRKFTFRFKNRTEHVTPLSVYTRIRGAILRSVQQNSVAKKCVTAVVVEEEHHCIGIGEGNLSSGTIDYVYFLQPSPPERQQHLQ